LTLQEGNTALARRDYAAAEADAREVLATAKGPRTTDAQFLLAETLAARKDYSGAAVAYDDTYNRNRTGSRAQDSLLGLATSLTAINERRAACETLDKLRAEFPIPRADLKESVAEARRAANCR
jgi:TolA-binding protein